MTLFFAMRIIENKTTYAKVPAQLKAAVSAILIEKGREELIHD